MKLFDLLVPSTIGPHDPNSFDRLQDFIIQLSDCFPVLLNILLLLSTQKIGRDDEEDHSRRDQQVKQFQKKTASLSKTGDKIASIQYSFGPLALLFIGFSTVLLNILLLLSTQKIGRDDEEDHRNKGNQG